MRERFTDTEERAVSPVIGVILMVAITVLLASVVAIFVLGFGVGASPPNVKFDISEEEVNFTNSGSNEWAELYVVTIVHQSGETLDTGNIEITVDEHEPQTVAYEINGSDSARDRIAKPFNGTDDFGAEQRVEVAFTNERDAHDNGDDLFYDSGEIDASPTASDSIDVETIEPGETIRITWENKEESYTLREYKVKEPGTSVSS